MNITKIRHEIKVANTFISRDEATIVDLQAALNAMGDVRAEAAKWRLEQSRKGLPITVLPLKLNEKLREAESVQDTINAAKDAIVHQQEKITRLEVELKAALADGHAASWDRVCDEARAVCADLEVARVAYLAASKKLYALHQSAKPGEFFPPDVNTHYAPDFANTLRRPYDIATGYDLSAWQRELAPVREQAIAWRNTLAENPEAQSPF